MLGCAKYEGTTGRRGFCKFCGIRWAIHRKPVRLRVLEGGKEEGTMAATSESNETSASEQRQVAAIVGEALLLAAPGALVYVTVPDADKWEALKELTGASVRLSTLGGWERVAETIDLHRGGVTLKAHGPLRPATMADHARIQAQREEG